MHTLGKVLAWLVILAAGGATLMTAKLIQVRNGWTRSAEKLEKDYEALQPRILKAERERDALRQELARVTLGWDRTYNNITTNVINPAEGRLAIDLGKSLGLKENQWLYGFEVQPDGSSLYRGAYRISQLGDAQSALVPAYRVRPEDAQGLRGGQWRWRTMIPTAYSSNFTDLELQLVRLDELLADRTQNVAVQDQLLAEANAQVERRQMELLGGEGLPKEEIRPTEERLGLVAAVEEAEAERNQTLVDIESLRARLRAANEQIESLQAENTRLAGELPRPTTQSASARR